MTDGFDSKGKERRRGDFALIGSTVFPLIFDLRLSDTVAA